MSENNNDSAWHLDKRIPLAFIFAILLQTAGGAWFASSLNEKVARNTEVNYEQTVQLREIERRNASQSTTIALILQRIEGLTEELRKTNVYLRELAADFKSASKENK